MQNLQPQTYIMIFIFSGLALVGLLTMVVAVLYLCQSIFDRKPTPDERRWYRDWDNIEREINK